jgi:hypothetical protein
MDAQPRANLYYESDEESYERQTEKMSLRLVPRGKRKPINHLRFTELSEVFSDACRHPFSNERPKDFMVRMLRLNLS